MLPNSFYKVSITLVPKPDKGITHTHTHTHTHTQNHRPTSLMNINEKILNKILANPQYISKFNNTLKGSYTMINCDLSQGCKDGSIYCKSINIIYHINN